MISLAIQLTIISLLLGAVVVFVAARFVFKKTAKPLLGIYFDAVFLGIVLARLSYITLWWQDYWQSPLAVFALADGGYIAEIGILTGLFYLLLKGATKQKRCIYASAALVGSIAFYGLHYSFNKPIVISHYPMASEAIQPLEPKLEQTKLADFSGKITVVNLWATWCPPCRREMPQFMRAQEQMPNVNIVMLNQGESALQVADFLADKQLKFNYVYLDKNQQAMALMDVKALPSTWFINQQGELVYQHMGELSTARIKDIVQDIERTTIGSSVTH